VLGRSGAEGEAGAIADAFTRSAGQPDTRRNQDCTYVVCETRTGHAILVTPPIGLQQIFWSVSGGRLQIASSPALLAQGAAGIPDAQAFFNYVYFHCIPGPTSLFAGVAKLGGGHMLAFDGVQATTRRYWKPGFAASAPLAEGEAARQLHELLQAATRTCIGDTENFGAFLSGGLDSSTVAGLAAQVRPGVPTVSMGFDVQGFDEMEYARIAARHFGTRAIEYYVTPDDVLHSLPRVAAAFAEPFGNSSAAAAFHCARVARENGLAMLLAGDGGDEIFGGNERYARQLVFERYGRIPGALRRGLLEPAVAFARRLTSGFPVNKASSYIAQANVPLPDRLQSYNFLHRHDPAEVFSPELLGAVDRQLPLRMLREEYGVPDTDSAINRMLFLDWKFTLHDNDLVKVNTMCRLAGVQVAYPMLDQAVVDFSLQVPGDWKVRNGELRWFYKRAMSSFLPRQIIDKSKHGFGLPFGHWTRSHHGLSELSRDALNSLAARRIFRPEFIDTAQRLHREAHASYYGELVWILMVLELWLQAHMPRASL
jgi:asparagine synthase (glutamine-hydrolysing)